MDVARSDWTLDIFPGRASRFCRLIGCGEWEREEGDSPSLSLSSWWSTVAINWNRTAQRRWGGRPSTHFSSVTQLCPTLCDPMDCSTPGFPVHHQLPELAQTPVHRVGDAIWPSHPLSSPSPPTFNLSQHQGLFQWVSSSNQVARVLEFQLQHQSFQWIFRTDFL